MTVTLDMYAMTFTRELIDTSKAPPPPLKRGEDNMDVRRSLPKKRDRHGTPRYSR